MARKRSEEEPNGTYEVNKGDEAYRGHVLRKWFVSLDGVGFHRVDILPLGIASARPLAMTQYPAASASLERAVSEAKKVVGWFIKYGTDLDAVHIPVDYTAKDKDPFDSLVMKSSTGKRSVCERHWKDVKTKAVVGRVNAIIFGIVLMQRFMTKLAKDGLMTNGAIGNGYTMNMLLDSYAPICCWLGDEVVEEIMEDANPETILAKAAKAQP